MKEKLGHGEWLPWLKNELDWSQKTASNFMRVAQEFKLVNFTNLDFAPTALYLLASSSEETREEALSLAESGERITHQKAQEIIAKHKAEAEAAMEGFTTHVSGGFA